MSRPKGFKHSEETKQKMCKEHKKFSEETKQKMRKAKSKEARQKMRAAKLGKQSNNFGHLGKKRSEETKQKMRKPHEFSFTSIKGIHGKRGLHNGIPYQSSYELKFMQILDEHKIPYERADNKNFRVKYIFEGHEHFYYPDFYLPREKSIVEIKSLFGLTDVRTKIKLTAARQQYGKRFFIITEQELPELTRCKD